jgi:surface antigen Omp85-like protein
MILSARGLLLVAAVLPTAQWARAAQPDEPAPAADVDGPTEGAQSGGGFLSRFKDPLDGRLDVTAGSEGSASGFVPIIVPGNDPALGTGLMGAIVYFHPESADLTAAPGNNPPTMTGGGVGFTDKESWAAAGAHSAVWNGGRTRYLAVLGAASINLDYFGTDAIDLSEHPLRFNIEGGILVQEAKFKLGDSLLFAGVRYQLLTTNVVFDVAPTVPVESGRSMDAGLGLVLDYDSRDNTFTPNEGMRAGFSISYFSEALGGDFDYAKFNAASFQYWQLNEQHLTLGLRLEYAFAEDAAPFYSEPWVSLRGIPILRYLGNHVITAEIEPRWKIDERWSVVGFTGIGRAAKDLKGLDDAEAAYNIGTGFRYLLSRQLGLAGGIDIARGPEDTAIYLTFGNAWGM